MTGQFHPDDAKYQDNIRKRSIRFVEAVEIFDGSMFTAIDERFECNDMLRLAWDSSAAWLC